jgi:flavin reductase
LITSAEFRQTMRMWPTGVAIVTSVRADGSPEGMTVNSLISVALEPPLVLISLARPSRTLEAVEESDKFAASILAEGAEELCWSFAQPMQARSFEGFEQFEGVPVVSDCLVAIVCRVERRDTVADHDLIVGQVQASKIRPGGVGPLVFHAGALRDLGLTAAPFDFYDGW